MLGKFLKRNTRRKGVVTATKVHGVNVVGSEPGEALVQLERSERNQWGRILVSDLNS